MFKKRENIYEIEEGNYLSPKFDSKGLIPVVTTDCKSGDVLMVGGNVTIGELVDALNSMDVKPRDLIQILITIKASGAMQAGLEVI